MGFKFRQAVQAGRTILREPLHIPEVARLLDAVMDTRVMRGLYAGMLRGLSPAETAHLRELTLRPLDLAEMARLPANTFGREYAAFAQRNGFTNTNVETQISAYPPIAALLAKDWVLHRFVKIHDLEHVLTGFDTHPAAEVGLQVFNFRNYNEPFGLGALISLPLVMARYGEPVRMVLEVRRGWGTGVRARSLFTAPLEDWLALDVRAVRRRLRLPEGAYTAMPEEVCGGHTDVSRMS